MQDRFKKYIEKYRLIEDKDIILIAISGGADSIVLLDLLVKCNYKVVMAHCNFNLRGHESDEDEAFVKQLAKQYNVKLHVTSFNTIEYADANKLSIEMAARELRYHWFNQLIEDCNYDKIATGHHLNDSIETLFLNLARGTGYAGIKGIPGKNDNIIRPLLFATRENIEAYANKNDLSYRNDSSNNSTKFLRNLVRQNIIPAFKQLNPAFEQVMSYNFNNLNEATEVLDNYFDDYRKKSITKLKKQVEIPFYKILGKSPVKIHLFQLIRQFGFNRDAVEKIIDAIKSHPGKIFESHSHRLLIDRDAVIIKPLSEPIYDSYKIETIEDVKKLPIVFNVQQLPYETFNLIKDKRFACIDSDKLAFPLTLRKWKNGDHFYPLGMGKKKKLSDFFIDQKINRIDKDEIWILESDHKIVWIVGQRIDDRFKVTNETVKVLVLEYIQ